MKELNPQKLHVTFRGEVTANKLSLPRRYTLTHSDFTGELYLTIGSDYDRKQIAGLYTRWMRDEVLAELKRDGADMVLHVYCHVSGGFAVSHGRWGLKWMQWHKYSEFSSEYFYFDLINN